MENRSLVTIAEHSKEKILYMLEMAKLFQNSSGYGWKVQRTGLLQPFLVITGDWGSFQTASPFRS